MSRTRIEDDLTPPKGNGATQLPSGTDAQRPTKAPNPSIRFNTTDGAFEMYDGQWRSFAQGGFEIDVLVQAGGGGSGGRRSSGGGAGGLITSFTSNRTISAVSSVEISAGTTYTITVGAGGAAAPGGNPISGSKGGDSIISGSGLTTITANGGGAGGSMSETTSTTQNGGCGAGGTAASACDGLYGNGTSGQGFDGGIGSKLHSGGGGGGGGGGGTKSVGVNGTLCVNNSYGGGSKAGGDGTTSSIGGSAVTYGTGGTAINGYSGTPTAGAANTGDGADGDQEAGNSRVGAAGGSGIVILRIPTANYNSSGNSGGTVSTDGSNTILTFTSSGSYTA